MSQPEVIEASYRVNRVSGLSPSMPVEGYIAYATGDGPFHFLDAVDALEDKAQEGIIGILPTEFAYSAGFGLRMMHKLVDAGTPVNGILTFGASKYSSLENGASHLQIVARDLDVPLCVAKKPLGYRRRTAERTWVQKSPLAQFQGSLGTLALSSRGRKVTVSATRVEPQPR